MLYHDPAAKTHNRLGFTLSMAIALHVAVILGLGFALQLPKAPASKRIDITLSQFKTDKNIYDADFVAQTNQEASGTESSKKELTTDHQAAISSAVINDTQVQQLTPRQRQASQQVQIVSTQSESDREALSPKQKRTLEQQLVSGRDDLYQRQLEIASLQAKLDQTRQEYARLPKVRRLSSVATKAAVDAEYLYHWQQRIEAIGNEHYPQQARTKGLYGDLQMVVSIHADGTLEEAKVVKSSGHKLLDDAALRIVRLASPYAPFPPEIRKDADMLEIVRTWRFSKNQFSQLQ
ncbi:Protein TonB [BD1-7 clade bacterium]|uniref:Protein TonB n=1 Tax=BD1-7 clade bacterium TaxID=2029982 RepID=A0A5S9QC72_9GAMM|nr:Protein TonB [BD1-7 clade bacterium]